LNACKNNKNDLKKVNPFPGPSKELKSSFEKSEPENSAIKNKGLSYFSEQLDNTKGLSNSSVNTIFQDSENLLWIGTWDGLNRYDGSNFKIFRPEYNNKKSLSNQVILKIDEDHSGKIWILTLDGINRFDKKNNTFDCFYFKKKNKAPLSEAEYNMALNGEKKVFCAVKGWGIGFFDGEKFQLLQPEIKPTKAVKKMEFSSTGALLILNENNELYSYCFKSKKNKQIYLDKIDFIADDVRNFTALKDNKIFINSNDEIGKFYSLTSRNFKIIETKKISNIIGLVPKGLVVESTSGYLIYDFNGTIVAEDWIKHLKNQKITALIQGSENVIWTGTDGDGITKIYPVQKLFNLVSKQQVTELNGAIVRTFLQDDDESLWVGTKGKGLFKMSSAFYLNNKQPINYQNFNQSNSLLNNSVYALGKNEEGLIFIGSDGEGLSILDTKTGKILDWKLIQGSDKCTFFKSVYAICQDENGLVWLGTNGYGMIRCKIERSGNNLKVSEFKRYLANDNQSNTLSSNIVFSIIPKDKNQLWIGTRLGGLNLFDKKTERFQTFKNIINDKNSLSNNDILCLKSDAKNRLWIGTSFGLNLLANYQSKEKPIFKNFSVKDGLPNNTIHGIVCDNNFNIWITTNFGLSNFNSKTSKFTNYTQNEGLQNNEFSDGAFYSTANRDYLFVGGIKGFNYFSPLEIKESKAMPAIFIDKISGHNQAEPYYQSLVIKPTETTFPSITLNYNQNFFDIDLSALTYINNEKCKYAYKLDHFDKNWNSINNRKTFSFTNVPKGDYSLWIKWTNSDGIWTNPVRAIDIKIKPVFWQSNLAFTAYFILIFLFILFVLSYYKKRQSLNQNIIFRKREEEMHENRLTFFTDIAHEFQTPLTLIVGPIQKLSETSNLNERNQKFIKMIQRNSSRLLFLTQQLLEFRKAEYNYLFVNVKKFDLVNLVEQIAELFDDLALDRLIDYKIKIPSELKGWFDKDKTEKILFNLMSNAFKYTPKNGKIEIEFKIINENQTLNITVINSGKGIPKEKLNSLFDRFFLSDPNFSSDNDMFRTGIGLAYIKKLVTVLRGEILVSSIPNKDTCFTILLPCNREAFTEKEIDIENSPVLISHHLSNILEEIPTEFNVIPIKMSHLEHLEDHRKIILIVEDEKEIHLFLNNLLEEKYKIISAYNGLEALEILKSTLPDIIISDIMMPIMDGTELCKKVKTNVQTCHIPFIMLTAKDSVLNRIEGIDSGANSYIAKPFYPDHLLIRIEKLIEEKELILKHFKEENGFENFSTLPIHKDEKDFIKKIIDLIHINIDNENLQSSFIEKELGISNSQLYRKIKQIFGFTPGDLIRTIRLKFAAELLRKNALTVSEVCYQSGFNNRSYFYREFKKMFNTTPKNYQLTYNLKK
jgi:signal transduction histidine kinase/ligand-binding sensor domain-containing protein/DNA-binding response OmpR family regulator